MIMIRAIVRPEKQKEVLGALDAAGFPSATVMDVYGRGKQRGIKVGNVFYDELPKTLVMLVVDDACQQKAVDTIMDAARTGETGTFGDGRVFVTPVLDSYTISTKSREL